MRQRSPSCLNQRTVMKRPTNAKPIDGLFLGSPRHQSPLGPSPPVTPTNPSVNSNRTSIYSKSQSSLTGNPGLNDCLLSPRDAEIACELERLADERNIPEILTHGFMNGSSCLRISLSPKGVLQDTFSSDLFVNPSCSQTSGARVLNRFRNRKQANRGTFIITSDD